MNKDNQEGFSKMSINWYPGHMDEKCKNIVEICLSGSNSLSLKNSCFKDNEIIDFCVSFSTGNLKHIADYIVELPGFIYHDKIICNISDDIAKLNILVNQGYKVRIWSSHLEPDSYLLLLFICNYLKNKVDSLSVIYSDEYNNVFYSIGVMSGKEIEKLIEYEHTLTKIEINEISKNWNSVLSENSDLRIIENGTIKSIKYNYFDEEILSLLEEKDKLTVADICCELVKKYYLSDSVFILLISNLIESGKIKVINEAERFMKSVIKKLNNN